MSSDITGMHRCWCVRVEVASSVGRHVCVNPTTNDMHIAGTRPPYHPSPILSLLTAHTSYHDPFPRGLNAAGAGVIAYGLLNELYYTTAFAFLWLGPMGASAIVAPASLGLRETVAISAKQFGKVGTTRGIQIDCAFMKGT